MLWFSLWVIAFTVTIVVVVYAVYAAKQCLDAQIKAKFERKSSGIKKNALLRTTQAVNEEKERLGEAAKLASLAHGKTFDLVAGNTIFATVFLWTLALHSYNLSYITLQGVWGVR